ncbi:hypothetical protein HDV00_010263 [Rhizophlyctis rosea]|nr:hypothetical protein HDV00_010263 [Rhizophlyctis rosea]
MSSRPSPTAPAAPSADAMKARHKQYVKDFVSDLKYFARHPRNSWPSLTTRVGRNDGTWKIICDHFIAPDGKIIANQFVRLKRDSLKDWEVSEIGFINYNLPKKVGTRTPWRCTASGNMGHLKSRTDQYGDVWVKLKLIPRRD